MLTENAQLHLGGCYRNRGRAERCAGRFASEADRGWDPDSRWRWTIPHASRWTAGGRLANCGRPGRNPWSGADFGASSARSGLPPRFRRTPEGIRAVGSSPHWIRDPGPVELVPDLASSHRLWQQLGLRPERFPPLYGRVVNASSTPVPWVESLRDLVLESSATQSSPATLRARITHSSRTIEGRETAAS
jgi:hypothetical protein